MSELPSPSQYATEKVIAYGEAYAEARGNERYFGRINRALQYVAGSFLLSGSSFIGYDLLTDHDTTNNVGTKLLIAGFTTNIVREFATRPRERRAHVQAEDVLSKANALSNVDYYGEDAAQPVEWLVEANAAFEKEFHETVTRLRSQES